MKTAKTFTLAIVLACMTSAAAFAAATPKADSPILHDKIVLSDVFDGVTANADYYLAPAPALGQSTTLNYADLQRISDAFNLGWTAASQLDRVVIRRAASEITRLDVQEALTFAVDKQMKGQPFGLDMPENAKGFIVPENADKTVNVDALETDPVNGSFRALVSVAEERREISGRFYLKSKVPVLKNPMRPGDVVTDSDIEYIDMKSTDIRPGMITDAAQLIGQTPRRMASAQRPLALTDVQPPTIVKKGELVTMVLAAGSMSLTMQGRALDDGSKGASVRVMNTASKKILDAVVTGTQAVSVQPPTNTL